MTRINIFADYSDKAETAVESVYDVIADTIDAADEGADYSTPDALYAALDCSRAARGAVKRTVLAYHTAHLANGRDVPQSCAILCGYLSEYLQAAKDEGLTGADLQSVRNAIDYAADVLADAMPGFRPNGRSGTYVMAPTNRKPRGTAAAERAARHVTARGKAGAPTTGKAAAVASVAGPDKAAPTLEAFTKLAPAAIAAALIAAGVWQQVVDAAAKQLAPPKQLTDAQRAARAKARKAAKVRDAARAKANKAGLAAADALVEVDVADRQAA